MRLSSCMHLTYILRGLTISRDIITNISMFRRSSRLNATSCVVMARFKSAMDVFWRYWVPDITSLINASTLSFISAFFA